MSANMLQLINGIDPRGRRYGPDDRERAYAHWLVAGRRSLARTAGDLQIAENTVRAWARDDDWMGRAERDDHDAAELARRALANVVTDQIGKSLDTVIELRDNPETPAKVRLDAATYILGVWGVVPTKVSEVVIRPSGDTKPVHAHPDFATMSLDDLRALESSVKRAS